MHQFPVLYKSRFAQRTALWLTSGRPQPPEPQEVKLFLFFVSIIPDLSVALFLAFFHGSLNVGFHLSIVFCLSWLSIFWPRC